MTIPFIRVIDLETTGGRPPAHGVVEIGWQDVALSPDGSWALSGEGGALYVDPGRPIPAVTMAVHHIEDTDVAGAGRWDEVGPPVLRPNPRPIALAAHRAAFEQRFCAAPMTGGADWICTWKAALRLWPDSPSFSNQILRYWRRPAGLDRERGLPVHRAFPDAYVTAHHLRDALNTVGPDLLIAWEKEPGLLPRVPSGADRGRHWEELTDESLAGLAMDRDEDVRFTAMREVARRTGRSAAPAPPPRQGSLL